MNKIRLKPLPIKSDSIKIPKQFRLGSSLLTKVPFLYLIRKKSVEYKNIIVMFGPITAFVIFITLFILWWISSYRDIIPPSETIAIQNNLINMTCLILLAYLWGCVVKYRRLPIPRNGAF